jgi:tetratricopeptide (TPR) repeat protein
MGNRVEDLVNELFQPGKLELLRDELDKLRKEKLREEELTSWFNFKGSIESQLGNHKLARDYFKEGCERYSDSSILQFNYGMELELIGEIENAKKRFECVKPQDVDSRILLTIARIYYLWDYYDEGLEKILPIFKVYYDLGIVDDHFLIIRGLPTYSESFANLAVFAKLKNQSDIALEELENAKKSLHDYPFTFLEEKLKAFLTGDWSETLKRIDKELEAVEEWQLTGYNKTLKATIESRHLERYKESIKVLNQIQIPENDYQWYYDVLLLLKAEAAKRFNKSDSEEEYLQQFWIKQPMLFEPYHVFNFGLDEYQEKLKRIYRSRRKESTNNE